MNEALLRRFRRSLYLSLALACICLTYAEWAFIREMPTIAAVTATLMLVAYGLEGRWALTIRAANFVGAGVAVLLVLWLIAQLQRPGDSLVQHLDFPASVLCYLGPPVLILIPIKLLRTKHLGDYWGFQVIGLMAVALGAALAGDGLYAVLLVVYFASVVACLIRLEQLTARAADTRPPAIEHGSDRAGRRIVTATTMASGLALGLFAVTPRMSDAKWELTSIANRMQTGLTDQASGIDINRTGELKPNNDAAVTVRASYPDGSPKLDLSPNHRWRSSTFNYYEQGRWSHRNWARTLVQPGNPANRIAPGPLRATTPILPTVNLGRGQYLLEFSAPALPRGPHVFSDPVHLVPSTTGTFLQAAIETLTDDGNAHSWSSTREGDLLPPTLAGAGRRLAYRQVSAPSPEPGLSPPLDPDTALIDHLCVISGLTGLRKYSDDLVVDMVASGQLAWDGRPGEDRLPAEFHEAVAREFTVHLRSSGQFQYSYNLGRVDRTIDPAEDFVLNVRQGHCNRFSTALALLLRCQRIPARVVNGYLGADANGDGSYVLRQSHAHSWVEILIRRPAAAGGLTWRWLTLDPTPFSELDSDSQLGKWFEGVQRGTTVLFRDYVLEFNADRQAKAKQWLQDGSAGDLAKPLGWIAGGVGLVAIVALLWRSRIAVRSTAPFAQLLEMIGESRLMAVGPATTGTDLLTGLATHLPAAVEPARIIVADHFIRRFGGGETDPAAKDALRAVATLIESAGRAPTTTVSP